MRTVSVRYRRYKTSVDMRFLLNAHIDRFNAAVLSGHFNEMVSHFAEDASMSFEGVSVGPFHGREAIAAAYATQPPDDQLLLLEVLHERPDLIEVSYAWAKGPEKRAGTMTVEGRDGLISSLVVRFE